MVVKNTFVDSVHAAGELHEDDMCATTLRRSFSDPTMGAKVPLDVGMPVVPTPPPAASRLPRWSEDEDSEDELSLHAAKPDLGVDEPTAWHTMQSQKTAGGVLEVAFQNLPALSAEAIAEALHLAARRLAAPQSGAFSSQVLPPLLAVLQQGVATLQGPQQLSRLMWALGKLNACVRPNSSPCLYGVEECVLHVCSALPRVLAGCTHLDLTNMLWGLAKVCPGAAGGGVGAIPLVRKAAHAVVGGCAAKVSESTAQGLANSFWAMARLKMSGPGVETFLGKALRAYLDGALFDSFTSQGVANVLWALATLRAAGVGRGPQDSTVRLAIVALAKATSSQLQHFQLQELSMVAWSFAKLYESRAGGAQQGGWAARPIEVDLMLMELAAVATKYVDGFEGQGISNIAWALATLELTGPAPAVAPGRAFIRAAVDVCACKLEGYSGQAIANLLWACTRSESAEQHRRAKNKSMGHFCSAVADEMMHRITGGLGGVTWRDLSSVAIALMHSRRKSPAVMNYIAVLVHRTAEQVVTGGLSAQQILNIAQAAARMKVSPSEMQMLVNSIEDRVSAGGLQFNHLDWNQWNEVQQWCPPTRFYSASTGSQTAAIPVWGLA
ncbi:unnamed protein product [Prorocentrum cordatum]|uniref:Uncharacterized protein n=1 Tax=Prorocentrum cordatum TaxID=2364126 RepID=A0ABN9XED2_9DINO|nr:unnamed protein product [Polarella glacialis]